MDTQDLRVRYSWLEEEGVEFSGCYEPGERHPKNTLVTARDNDVIFFGIARCHVPLDTMSKEKGKALALNRLNSAFEASSLERPNMWVVDGSFRIHRGGLFGQVGVEEIKKLLQYFDNLDEIMLKKWNRNV